MTLEQKKPLLYFVFVFDLDNFVLSDFLEELETRTLFFYSTVNDKESSCSDFAVKVGKADSFTLVHFCFLVVDIFQMCRVRCSYFLNPF